MIDKYLPLCPKCKQNANVIKYLYYFRCAYCNIRFFETKDKQTKLFIQDER
jgi:uncharacterized CHY-type Zn-finger protein